MANPNIANEGKPYHFQKGNQLAKNKLGMKYKNTIKERMLKHMHDLPDGLTPWEKLAEVFQDESMTPDLKVKAAKYYCDVMKDADTQIEVSVEHSTSDDIKSMLMEQLGYINQDEEESDDEEEDSSATNT